MQIKTWLLCSAVRKLRALVLMFTEHTQAMHKLYKMYRFEQESFFITPLHSRTPQEQKRAAEHRVCKCLDYVFLHFPTHKPTASKDSNSLHRPDCGGVPGSQCDSPSTVILPPTWFFLPWPFIFKVISEHEYKLHLISFYYLPLLDVHICLANPKGGKSQHLQPRTFW